jgi:hypothetical protein
MAADATVPTTEPPVFALTLSGRPALDGPFFVPHGTLAGGYGIGVSLTTASSRYLPSRVSLNAFPAVDPRFYVFQLHLTVF